MLLVIEHERMAVEFRDLEETGFSGAVGIDDGSSTPVHRALRLTEMPNPESTLFDICSVTKSVTAAAILQLESKGCLSLDQTLDRFFDLPPEMAEITIHQVLMHSSGLGDFLSPIGEPREYSLEQDYEPLSRDDLLQQVRRSRLLAPAGERWSYSNTGYSLLAAIIEEITDEKFEGYLRRALLAPLGMHDTGYTFPTSEHPRVASGRMGSIQWGRPTDKASNPSWNLIGNGGLLSTMPDLLRWRTAFCTLLVDSCKAPIVVEPPIWSGYGCFLYQADSELGNVVYHNGDNGVFSATIRWFPKLSRFLAVVSNDSEHSALQVARRISDCWKR
jgi:CubicO group peptidase (beta-lactamase class C family)